MTKKNIIKIISGKYKGYKLKIYNSKKLKPTTSITKKILFDWIKNWIKNKICIDLFAGSGSLGLECLSRKSKYVIFIEKNFKIFKILKKNLYFINKKKYITININAISWIKKIKYINFDIIFIDPPYINNYINNIIYIINNLKLKKKYILIYIEISIYYNKINIPSNWILYKKKKIHSTYIFLYIKKHS